MKQLSVSALLLLLWGTFLSSAGLEESEYKTSDWTKTLKDIKDGLQKLHTYYLYFKYIKNAFDIISGSDGVCQFKCPDGETPVPRRGHNPSSNGCSAPLFVFLFDIRIPSITNCCNQHDRCYDTCGQKKLDCDEQFQVCLNTICRNLLNVLGLDRSTQACQSGLSLIFDSTVQFGCKPYLDSQRAACICRNKDRTEL